VVITRQILFLGVETWVACDGLCTKAWGMNTRPTDERGRFLLDTELAVAPALPRTSEGRDMKPRRPPAEGERFNRWCVRECERSALADYDDRTEQGALEALDATRDALGAVNRP